MCCERGSSVEENRRCRQSRGEKYARRRDAANHRAGETAGRTGGAIAMEQILKTGTYSIFYCAQCSIGFGISTEFERMRRADRTVFSCPAGHLQWFPGQTDEATISELKQQMATIEQALEATRCERDKNWRLQRAAEGRTRAIKARVAAGVCLCCNRTFQNLARHMQTEHPTSGKFS